MKRRKILRAVLIALMLALLFTIPALAAESSDDVVISIGGLDNSSNTLRILFLITLLALVPSILIMMTGFTRIVIVLSFVRNALGLQQTPPNQVLIGLALFLTLFIMSPVLKQINEEAYTPYSNGEITQEEAISKAMAPIRTFMLKNTNTKDLNVFINLAKLDRPKTYDDIPTEVLIPAFITSELKRAFIMGFLIYLPFLIIDMVVSSVLMSMGMVMLPPTMISLPFKVILFVLVDGWDLLVKSLVTSFN
ncbi:MAG TPA: flagellar type III secretion system pore protein FliP [Clostridiales bacterium]|nr:flagellar type III secretion system pore protein FliP [Clostridiales bacterium]